MKADRVFPSGQSAIQVHIASTRRELVEAYELVYRCFLGRGYINPHPGGIVYKQRFGLDSSRTLVASTGSRRIIGTLSVVGDSPLGLEVESTYAAEVAELRARGRRLAEITSLAIDRPSDVVPRETFFRLTQFMIQYSYWQGYDDLLLAVHPRHHRFYWECFRVYPVGPCRSYAAANGNPAICCRIDLRHLHRNVDPHLWGKYFSTMLPDSHYQRPVITPDDHAYLLGRSGLSHKIAFPGVLSQGAGCGEDAA